MSLHLDRVRSQNQKAKIEAKRLNGRTFRIILVCVVLFYLAAAFTIVTNNSNESSENFSPNTQVTTPWRLLLVNDKNSLPDDFTVELHSFGDYSVSINIRQALDSMVSYAKEDGITLDIDKAYEEYSALDPYSEHPTGLCVDIEHENMTSEEFSETKEYIWLSENAANFGFIERYPENKEDITGKQWEAWHYRYIGIEAAQKANEENYTLEEFLDIYY